MTLKYGSSGEEVRLLQKALGITSDGKFGPMTEKTVKAYQTEHKLAATGIVNDWLYRLITGEKNEFQISITRSHLTRKITRLKSARIPRYLVIHYTAGSSSTPGRAQRVRDAWQNSDRQASADYVVDDATIIEANPGICDNYTWAVGDGKGAYGITNANSIHIEMCSTLRPGTSVDKPNHAGWSITPQVRQNTLKLAAMLMRRYGIGMDRIVRHYDASRKCCPGLVGWNCGVLYNTDGSVTKEKNTDIEWERFKLELASML